MKKQLDLNQFLTVKKKKTAYTRVKENTTI